MRDNSVEQSSEGRFAASVFSSPDRVKHILEISGVRLWELNLATMESYWTKSVFDTFGQDAHSGPVSFDSIVASIHPDDRAAVQRAVEQAASRRIDVDYRIVRPDGQLRYVRAQATTAPDADAE